MGTSGNPAKKAAKKLELTPVDEWLEEVEGQLTELPSGKVVRVITPGMETLVTQDAIPNSLMPIVMGAINGEGNADEDVKKLSANPQTLVEMSRTMDKIFCICVTEPQFQLPPADGGARERSVLYVDRVPQMDKSFVFQLAVGGTRDLEQFRREQDKSLARVSTSEGVSLPTE